MAILCKVCQHPADPASRNFLLDPAGNPVCRACAGTPLHLDHPLAPNDSLPMGWMWLE